jgi:hypothetical protein
MSEQEKREQIAITGKGRREKQTIDHGKIKRLRSKNRF